MNKNNLLRKGLVIGTLILFVGVNIIPTILGTDGKRNVLIDGGQRSSTFTRGDNTLYVGGTGPNNYTWIQDAIDNATDGDTVFVYDDSSPYYENVVVDKSIYIIGEDRDTTIIDGGGSGEVVHISADEVNIDGFTIQNGAHGFVLQYTSHCNISGNLIANNSENGIYLDYSPQNTFYNNKIIDNDESGITIFSIYWSSYLNNIQRNTIMNNGLGIFLFFTSQDTITQNTIANNNEGIRCERPENITVYHNNFINNIQHATVTGGYNTHWDNGYSTPFEPSTDAGNYWDDYTGEDYYYGPSQNISGSDGIGDIPYNIPGIEPNSVDNYPFMIENGWMYTCGDVNGNGAVTPGDGFYILNYLGSGPPPVTIWHANVNGEGGITPGDGFYLLNYLSGGPDLNCQPCSE